MKFRGRPLKRRWTPRRRSRRGEPLSGGKPSVIGIGEFWSASMALHLWEESG